MTDTTTIPRAADWYAVQATNDLYRYLERPNDGNKAQLDALLAEYRDACETGRVVPPRYFNHTTGTRR